MHTEYVETHIIPYFQLFKVRFYDSRLYQIIDGDILNTVRKHEFDKFCNSFLQFYRII